MEYVFAVLFRHCWPVLDHKAGAEFRKVTCAWLREIMVRKPRYVFIHFAHLSVCMKVAHLLLMWTLFPFVISNTEGKCLGHSKMC